MGMPAAVIAKVAGDGRIVGGIAFVSYKLPLGLGKVVVVPHGPVLRPGSGVEFDDIFKDLAACCRANNVLYVQVWPHAKLGDEGTINRYYQAGFTGPQLFHAHTFSSDLLAIDIKTQSEEQVLASARKQTRYYCRCARKAPLQLCLGTSAGFLKECHELWVETLRHHGAKARPLASYQICLDHLIKKGLGVLIQARHGDVVVGALAMLFAGGIATYLMAGIRREYSKLAPSEFLHLSAMQIARERGQRIYDLNNWSTPEGAQFKRGFRPVATIWAPPCSLILRPTMSKIVSWGEQYARGCLRSMARRKAVKARSSGEE